jgi:1,2-diacylglycerol 3-beta-glucosyltransferase
MLLEILFILSLLYGLQTLLFAVGAWLSRYPSDPAFRPSVSIVIAARNEEANIGDCLEAIIALEYPRELLEVIIVDDRSGDGTAAIVERYSTSHPFIRLLRAEPGTGHLHGKANAVTQGIEATVGRIILFTDADCQVKPGWVAETVKYYADDTIGMVAGFTELRGDGGFARMQALDWFFLFSMAAAGIRIGHPFTAVGNNLSVRRQTYDAVGGYRGIPFSVTEDYALFHAVTAGTAYRVRFPMDSQTLVYSRPCPTARQLYNQKQRWFTGGRDMEPRNLIFFSVSFLYMLGLLLLIPWMWTTGFWWPWIIRLLTDLLLLMPALTRFGAWQKITAFFWFEIYVTLYVVVYPPVVLAGRAVVWKERSFSRA